MRRELPQTITMDNGKTYHPKAGMYLADSELGLIWSTYKNDWLKGIKNLYGYLEVNLMCEEGPHPFKVHRLVWETFQGPIPQGMTINHRIEGEEGKQMNMLSNLELMTRGDNNRYGTHYERVAATKRNDPNQSKRVYQYTTELELVDIHPSTNEAGRQGFDQGHVAACCRGDKCYKTHKGYVWSYTPL